MDRDSERLRVQIRRQADIEKCTVHTEKRLPPGRWKNSLFFRLFISIMAVTVLILIVQMVVMVVMLRNQSEKFAEEAFSSYEQRLSAFLELSGGQRWTIETVTPLVLMAADDRILGLVLRDAQHDAVFALGKTPQGIIVDENPDTIAGQNERFNSEDPQSILPGVDREILSSLWDDHDDSSPFTPEQNVVGSVLLYADDDHSEVIGSVDVLVLSPVVYAMKAQLLRKVLLGFTITIPVALVIALLGAHAIARGVSRRAEKISRSVSSVALGAWSEPSYHTSYSELSQIGQSVDALKEQLAGHERMRQQWLRSIAHDLNTPVTSLKLSIDGASDGLISLDEAFVDHLHKEVEELAQRVGSVLTLASMESPDFHLRKEVIDVLDFVDEVLASREDGNRIVLDIKVDTITGDRRLLVLVAKEAIQNAFKYGEPGAVLRWSITTRQGLNVLQISHTGSLGTEDPQQLFEPWYRADHSRSQSGSGMGLAIIRQIMSTHGGNAELSQDGSYVTLTLHWPSMQEDIST